MCSYDAEVNEKLTMINEKLLAMIFMYIITYFYMVKYIF